MCPLTGTAPSPAACWFGVSSGQPDRRIASAMRQQLHARLDWAACVKELGDAHYPDAERIVLVLDQLGWAHAGSTAGFGQVANGPSGSATSPATAALTTCFIPR